MPLAPGNTLPASSEIMPPSAARRPHPNQHRQFGGYPGFTLIEQVVIIAVLGIVLAIALRVLGQALDALAVRGAAREIRDVFATAREYAVAGGVRTAVQIDPALVELSAHAGVDKISVRPIGQLHGVTLSTSRDSMAYSPSGLGYGASNLRIIVVRRWAAETVTVSRLGRVR